MSGETGTRKRDMTNGRDRPRIMQGPHHWLAVIKDLADIPEREQPLIDPRQMDYIRLLVFRQRSDIRTRTSRIDFEEMLPFEMQVTENAPPFPKAIP